MTSCWRASDSATPNARGPAQHLEHPVDAKAVRPLVADHAVAGPQGVVVGGGDVAFGRVEGMGQLVERREARPVEIARGSGHRQEARAPLADRGQARGLVPDVPVDVGVHEVLARHLPSRERLAKLGPVARPRQRKAGQVPGGAGLAAGPAQRPGADGAPGPRSTTGPWRVNFSSTVSLGRTLHPDGLALDHCTGSQAPPTR